MYLHAHRLAGVFALALLTACGNPGAPQPPSLQLPERVKDLAGWRKGNRVVLTWTLPNRTTDGQNIRRRGPTIVCRTPLTANVSQCDLVASVPPTDSKSETAVYVDTLPSDLQLQHPSGLVTYAIEATNERGRNAGLSNFVQVPLGPALPPPANFRTEVTPDGVVLSWDGEPSQASQSRYFYRILRGTPGSESDQAIGDVPSADSGSGFVDRTVEWGKRYIYRIASVTKQAPFEIEGDDSAPVEITPQDVFPPQAPTALEAVYSGPGETSFIDLTWASNIERDLAGYNVYRQIDDQPLARINGDPVAVPSFRDAMVGSGLSYRYFTTAVDRAGNESSLSPPATETVP